MNVWKAWEVPVCLQVLTHCGLLMPYGIGDLVNISWGNGLLQDNTKPLPGLPEPVNSLAAGRSWCDFKNVIFNLAVLIGIFKSSHDNVLRWMLHYLTDDKSTLVQVMAWCRQATSHYLSQCWPRSMAPYGITRPHWVNVDLLSARFSGIHFSSFIHVFFFAIWIFKIPIRQSPRCVWHLNN